ncbi:asparagine synthase-related protein [Candidatus Methylocalor cossyra]|uniref:asparagine synthase-related protein n=1 Tax=Candidatus Methylocalor cossyra TaxID=3108543 RepID=UPI0032B26C81
MSSALKMLRHRAAREPLSVAHILDQQSDRPGDGLIQVDHAGWVPGFQGRDHALVAWVSSLSPRLKLHGEEGKYLFNTSLGPYSPDRVRYRGKMGCAVAAWFRGPFRQKLRKTGVSPVMAQGFARSFLGPRLDPHRADIRDPSAGPWSAPMDQPFLRGNPSPSATA